MAEPLAKREKETRVMPYRVTLECVQPGCTGTMTFTGSGFTQIDSTWDHRCTECGHVEGIVNATYPTLRYREK